MADDFDFEYHSDGRYDDGEALKSWIPTIIMLFCFFPIGFIMLIYKLFGLSNGKRSGSVGQHPYDVERNRARQAGGEARYRADQARREANAAAQEARQAAQEVRQEARAAAEEVRQQMNYARSAARPPKGRKVSPPRKQIVEGRSLTIWGSIIAGIFGFGSLFSAADLFSMGGFSALLASGFEEVLIPLGFCGAGLVMLYYGIQKGKKAKRYRKYLALIGRRESISVISLAQAMGVSVHKACDDLQDMLDIGLIPLGFLDMGSGRLILNDEGLQDEPEPEREKHGEEPKPPKGLEREDEVLMEIRMVNDAISDEEMSRKIDRIGEITGKIFAYLREKPDKEGQLRSFLSYYLPTTLKILRAYAQMESQGIEGENITAAKERIEGMMDKVVDGFEKQLDKLFQDDAMDITTDVAVLERMLDKDGLGGGQGLQLGG
ncbi:MAG: hypothetical protein EOM52_05980 [Clostridia bacterium]|nr:hypothetical protein [Clostridia bacterium]